MMKKFAAVACVATMCTGMAFAADMEKLNHRVNDATAVLQELMATPDKSIPLDIAGDATCVAVVPGFKKGAFLVGAQYGQGLATCRTAKGWSAPLFIQLTGASFGFQAGGQSTDLVLVGRTHRSIDALLHDKVKLGGDLAASAGPVGRNSQAAISALGSAEFLTYSRSKGLFAGVDLTGDVVNDNKGDNEDYYGKSMSYQNILSGAVPTPAGAKQFIATVNKMFQKGRAR